jgi:TP901 family phage tail tape measure protein
MSTQIGKLYALVGADTSDFTRKMQGIGTLAQGVGRGLTMKLTAPLVALGGAAVKVAADFEQQLTNAFSVTGSTSEEVKGQMEALAREMGATTVFAAKDAADAMYFMASAGWKADDMAVALEDTLKLAAATQSDLAFATDTVVATLNQFQMGAEDAGKVADIFANAISNSQATMDKLNTSMSYVGPIAKSLNYSLEDTTAALMALYNKGIDASMAGTGLRMSLAKLMDPSEKSAKAIHNLGLSLDDVNPATKSLAEIVGALESKAMTASDAIQIFGVRAGPTMLNLVATGTKGLADFRDNLDATGTAAQMAETQMDTLKGQWKLVTSALSEAAIQIGKILIPILRDLMQNHIMPAIKWFSDLDDGWKKVILAAGAFAAALGPVLIVMGKLHLAMGMLGDKGPVVTKALGKVGAVGAAAFIGWQIGKRIGEIELLGKSINEHIVDGFSKAIEAVGLWSGSAEKGEGHTAALEKRNRMLAEASEIAGRKITKLHDALDILNDREVRSEKNAKAMGRGGRRSGR